MPVYMTARYDVRPESLDKCLRAVGEFVHYVKHNEPGTRLYVSMQEAENATSFLHVFIFDDPEAQQLHAGSEAVKRFTDVLYPETLAPVQFTTYNLVATTGD